MHKKTTRLRQLLYSDQVEFLMGAHDGLSAKIVEEAGFKGIWGSGLCVSASLGVRDSNEASWTQVLEVLEFMSDATTILILLDADTGYGDFNNVRRLVRKYVGILNNGTPAKPGQFGDIVVTNLNNYGLPFIRYCIEDIGAWRLEQSCPCGRALPQMEVVQGRRMDLFREKNGHTVWGGFASPLFGMPGVKQFQVVQKSLDLVIARIVREGPLDQGHLDEIERTVKTALGDRAQLEFEFCDEIPLEESGKYLYTILELGDLFETGERES